MRPPAMVSCYLLSQTGIGKTLFGKQGAFHINHFIKYRLLQVKKE
jgi:hypothetical protein